MSRQKDKTKKFFAVGKLAGLGFLLVLFLISTSVLREYKKQQKLENRISELRQELSGLKQNNLELTQMIGYLGSDEYLEMEARSNLGYKKAGEKVVIIDASKHNAQKKIVDDMKNYQKWFGYFFN